MSETEVKPLSDRHQRIGSVLAALLTVAILIVVFWQYRPGESGGRAPDVGDPFNRGDPFRGGRFENGIYPFESGWRAVSGPMVMRVTGNPGSSFSFQMRMFGAPMDEETRSLLFAQRNILRNPSVASSIGLTSNQLEKLHANQPAMQMAEGDEEQIKKLWKAWESADDAHKPAAQQALLEALSAAGQRNIEPAKKAWVDAAAAFKQILTTDQLVKMAVSSQNTGPMPFGNPPVAPATQPK
jgi:hypothetical protein